MKLGKIKINSSVIIANLVAILAIITDVLTNGSIAGVVVDVIMYFLDKPEEFRPYLTDKTYQFFLTFLPIVTIILRNTNVKYRPPVERLE